MRILLALALAFTIPAFGQDDKVARGKYLVDEVARCGDCHTPKLQDGSFVKSATLRGTQLNFAAAVPGSLRSRAEHLQTQVWIRNAAMLVSVLLVIGSFLLSARGAWQFHESVSLAMTIGWIGATWQSYAMRGRSTSVPTWLSGDELRAFHRRELRRQMDLGCHEFVYWSVPAVLLILYGLAVAVPGFRGGVVLLGALAMQNCVVAWAQRKERSRYQRELDRLDQEVEQE